MIATLVESETHTGMMIALWPDPETAERLAVEGGIPPEDLHITIGYCSHADLTDVELARLVVRLDDLTRMLPPFRLRVSGLGRFAASDSSDGQDVLYASIDSPALKDLRNLVHDALRSIGREPKNNHGFTPHITLKYLPPGQSLPMDAIEGFDFRSEYLVLAVGDEQMPFELRGDPATMSTSSALFESATGPLEFTEASGSKLIEPSDRAGAKWRVLMIRAGTSANRVHYSEEVLKKAAPLFEGIQAYADHPSADERRNRPERSVRDVVGWYDNVAWSDEHKGLTGDFHVLASASWLREALKSSWEGGKPDLLGFSINASGIKSGQVRDGGYLLEGITKVNSTDVVTTPGAGGRLLDILESATENTSSRALLTESLASFRRELLGEVRQLIEAWNNKGRRLSAAHKAAISASLKARMKKSAASDGLVRDASGKNRAAVSKGSDYNKDLKADPANKGKQTAINRTTSNVFDKMRNPAYAKLGQLKSPRKPSRATAQQNKNSAPSATRTATTVKKSTAPGKARKNENSRPTDYGDGPISSASRVGQRTTRNPRSGVYTQQYGVSKKTGKAKGSYSY